MTNQSIVTIFTDGSSRGNPGPGGYAAIIVYNDSELKVESGKLKVVEIGGREDHTTNNRMEIRAAIEALQKFQVSSFKFQVITDSSYLLNGITKWVFGWQKNGWRTATKQAVENQDLWQELLDATRGKKIDWKLVKGHVGVAGNQRCDEIATDFADGKKPQLFQGLLADYSVKNILDTSSSVKISQKSRESKVRSRAKAFSYVSSLDGEVRVHQTWTDCEKRVKGKSGARFKKVLSLEEEKALVRDWSV